MVPEFSAWHFPRSLSWAGVSSLAQPGGGILSSLLSVNSSAPTPGQCRGVASARPRPPLCGRRHVRESLSSLWRMSCPIGLGPWQGTEGMLSSGIVFWSYNDAFRSARSHLADANVKGARGNPHTRSPCERTDELFAMFASVCDYSQLRNLEPRNLDAVHLTRNSRVDSSIGCQRCCAAATF